MRDQVEKGMLDIYYGCGIDENYTCIPRAQRQIQTIAGHSWDIELGYSTNDIYYFDPSHS